jgi:hypothetical protein
MTPTVEQYARMIASGTAHGFPGHEFPDDSEPAGSNTDPEAYAYCDDCDVMAADILPVIRAAVAAAQAERDESWIAAVQDGPHKHRHAAREACGICGVFDEVVKRARAEEREAAAEIVEEFLAQYPSDIFQPPKPKHHGNTVDACSAAALRAVLPNVAAAIRARKQP